MEKKEKSVTIRFPPDLLEDLRVIARHHTRSLNGEIITALRAYAIQQKKKQEGLADGKTE